MHMCGHHRDDIGPQLGWLSHVSPCRFSNPINATESVALCERLHALLYFLHSTTKRKGSAIRSSNGTNTFELQVILFSCFIPVFRCLTQE